MKDRNFKTSSPENSELDPNPDAKAVSEDAAREDAEVKKLAADLEELRQTLVRHQANFANSRKRAEKENTEAGRRATARVIEQLIPIIDGFEHALAAHREAQYEGYRKGFELIYKQLLDKLAALGAERIEPQGQPFDPHLHQAVDRVESTEHPDGIVLEVYQPG